jgi:hypothetical protein
VRSTLLLVGLLLAPAAAAPEARAEPAPVSGEPAGDAGGGAVDWLLKQAARAFTSDNKAFGQVHLPVIASNPNSGVTYGVLPVWLAHNDRHEITRIFAPMLTYNQTYGVALSGSFYDYPSADMKLKAILESSERSNRRASVLYDDRSLFGGRATMLIDTNLEADGGVQFYGVGPASTRSSEASERLVEGYARAEIGARFWDFLTAAGGWTFRRTQVMRGPFHTPSSLPQSLLTTTTYSMPRFRLSRDSRDLPFTPSRGSDLEAFAEYSRTALGASADYDRYGGQGSVYLPTAANLVTALHAQASWSSGGDVPFTALSSLGGAHSLRGYAEGRFQDRGAAFANVEERWRVHSVDMIHALTEFQVAPFVEAGTVFPSWGRAQARYVEFVAGVATRAVIKPSIVGKVEVGAGREGTEAFVGIDYPF